MTSAKTLQMLWWQLENLQYWSVSHLVDTLSLQSTGKKIKSVLMTGKSGSV
ncbi:hypothetical protein CIB84_009951 [Bambusicola thoracicus]|uniref:Uncharacterized protein n=1 Tax=Bambusicola thoracicus TaxID=9083 RepID=A0A2P4SQA8_BAMTH|nr:hypothetical protein CIB84_009951 [Bambusicola thoracicus]